MRRRGRTADLRNGSERTSENPISRKFAMNNALKGALFIGNSSPLTTVVALYNFRRGDQPRPL
jgi:hypothetical protein